MSPITTHVLDTRLGRPAANIEVTLYRVDGDGRTELSRGVTDADGRIADLAPNRSVDPGRYALRFATGPYFEAQGIDAFYPWVEIVFTLADGGHHHVPLLLSPFGYTTYRGS